MSYVLLCTLLVLALLGLTSVHGSDAKLQPSSGYPSRASPEGSRIRPSLPACNTSKAFTPNDAIDLTQHGLGLCQQLCNEWCWATTITEVVTYLMQQPINCGADECTLASQFIYYETGQKLDCCTMGCYGYCDSPAQSIQNMVDMLSANGVTSQGVESSISIDALTNELSNMRPVILGYQGFGGGHVILCYGYDGNGNFYLADPWTGDTYDLPPSEFATYNSWQWDATIFGVALSGEPTCTYPEIRDQIVLPKVYV